MNYDPFTVPVEEDAVGVFTYELQPGDLIDETWRFIGLEKTDKSNYVRVNVKRSFDGYESYYGPYLDSYEFEKVQRAIIPGTSDEIVKILPDPSPVF